MMTTEADDYCSQPSFLCDGCGLPANTHTTIARALDYLHEGVVHLYSLLLKSCPQPASCSH